MLYREIIAVCSEIHTKYINTLCGQNVKFVNVKPGGAYSNNLALEVKEKPRTCIRRCVYTEAVRHSLIGLKFITSCVCSV
jgi:hypothetical protein